MAMRSRRGQVLVLAALTIAITIISTQAYIYQLSKTETSDDWSTLSDYVLSIEQGSRHVVVASLINVSRGGATSNLRENLDRWESFVGGDYRFGRCDLNSSAISQPLYSQGVWLDWGTDGIGVSSASTDWTMNLSGRGTRVDWDFNVNITTTAIVTGSYTGMQGDAKQVTVFLNLLNEGGSTLAANVNLSHFTQGEWRDTTVLESYSQLDFGNGTYRYVFTDDIPGNQVQIRVQIYDRREVFVQAEASLSEE